MGDEGAGNSEPTATQRIDAHIAAMTDWRGKTLARVRALIKQADPDVVEEWKWDIPVWSHAGIICTGETYKTAVKLTFAKGAALNDPAKLYTSSLEGNVRRAIDLRDSEVINEDAFRALIQAAVAYNVETAAAKKPKRGAKPSASPE